MSSLLSPKDALAQYRDAMPPEVKRHARLFNELNLSDRIELLFLMQIAANMQLNQARPPIKPKP
jgi:hypothetical protein